MTNAMTTVLRNAHAFKMEVIQEGGGRSEPSKHALSEAGVAECSYLFSKS